MKSDGIEQHLTDKEKDERKRMLESERKAC